MKRILCVVGVLLLLGTIGYAWSRASASYRTGPDAVTDGGGASASASSATPQQAAGEVAGYATSASYRNRAGVVQAPTGPPSTEVPDWRNY